MHFPARKSQQGGTATHLVTFLMFGSFVAGGRRAVAPTLNPLVFPSTPHTHPKLLSPLPIAGCMSVFNFNPCHRSTPNPCTATQT